MSYLKDREIWLSNVPTGNPPAGYFWKFIQNGKVVVRDSSGNDQMMVATSGSQAITGSLTVTGGITGTVSSASYVEYSNVANKPTLVSGSAQITYSGLTGIPSGIVSGSAQIASFGIFATTGSNGFNGDQSITGSLTVTGQVVAQTLNVQQVTSSIVYSSGSNIFGNSLSNTQQFTGSVGVTGSLTVAGAGTFASSVTAGGYITGQGNNPGGLGGSRYVLDWLSGQMRVFSYGADTSTNGGFLFNSQRSDGTNSQNFLSIASTGAATFSNVIQSYSSQPIYLFSTPTDSNYEVLAIDKSATDARIRVYKSGTGSYRDLIFETGGSNTLRLASTGAATFSSSVTAGGTMLSTNVGVDGTFADAFVGRYNSNTVEQNAIQTSVSSVAQSSGFRFQASNGGGSSGRTTIVDFLRDRQILYGNVGIGTTSPVQKLHVEGSATIGTTGTEDILLLGRALSGGVSFQQAASLKLGRYQNAGGSFESYTRLDFALRDNSPASNYNTNTTVMTLTNAGNVGIGTTSPEALLHLSQAATGGNGAFIFIDNPASSTLGNTAGIRFATNSGASFSGYGSFIEAINTNNSDGAEALTFGTWNGASRGERMRITSTGYVYLGNGWGATNHRINLEVAQGSNILVVSAYAGSNNDTAIFYGASGANPNAAATALGVTTNSSTGRSINAGGTINASGADYAEYMTKAVEDNIAKGDIVGIDSDAKVTNIFVNAISFAVKSTDPSYVGGDVWGNAVGKRPERTTDQTEEEFASILAEFEAELEIARAKVDRISFSGQVPCNVMGANVGDYIIPVETENGKIGGQAIPNPTFEQYQIAVGKVWKIMEDGRAWIAVKIG